MESFVTWVERIIGLLIRRGADAIPEILRLIEDAPSQEHVDQLHEVLKSANWYTRLGPELKSAIRSRQAAFQAAASDNDPSP